MLARSRRKNDRRGLFCRRLSVKTVTRHVGFGQVVVIYALAFIAAVTRKRSQGYPVLLACAIHFFVIRSDSCVKLIACVEYFPGFGIIALGNFALQAYNNQIPGNRINVNNYSSAFRAFDFALFFRCACSGNIVFNRYFFGCTFGFAAAFAFGKAFSRRGANFRGGRCVHLFGVFFVFNERYRSH